MKRLSFSFALGLTTTLAALLGGCGYFFERQTEFSGDIGEAPGVFVETAATPAAEPDSGDHTRHYLPVTDWLVQRQHVCKQDSQAINAQLEQYREDAVQGHAQLTALMLASCNPARTPGLLKQSLDRITASAHWSSEYTALFDLLESEYQAYALLEQKYRQLEQRHQKTIDGIGNIEKSLETQLDPNN